LLFFTLSLLTRNFYPNPFASSQEVFIFSENPIKGVSHEAFKLFIDPIPNPELSLFNFYFLLFTSNELRKTNH